MADYYGTLLTSSNSCFLFIFKTSGTVLTQIFKVWAQNLKGLSHTISNGLALSSQQKMPNLQLGLGLTPLVHPSAHGGQLLHLYNKRESDRETRWIGRGWQNAYRMEMFTCLQGDWWIDIIIDTLSYATYAARQVLGLVLQACPNEDL